VQGAELGKREEEIQSIEEGGARPIRRKAPGDLRDPLSKPGEKGEFLSGRLKRQAGTVDQRERKGQGSGKGGGVCCGREGRQRGEASREV